MQVTSKFAKRILVSTSGSFGVQKFVSGIFHLFHIKVGKYLFLRISRFHNLICNQAFLRGIERNENVCTRTRLRYKACLLTYSVLKQVNENDVSRITPSSGEKKP